MECLIKKALIQGWKKKAGVEVLARYLRIKYKISMDLRSLKCRLDQVGKEQMLYAGISAQSSPKRI